MHAVSRLSQTKMEIRLIKCPVDRFGCFFLSFRDFQIFRYGLFCLSILPVLFGIEIEMIWNGFISILYTFVI